MPVEHPPPPQAHPSATSSPAPGALSTASLAVSSEARVGLWRGVTVPTLVWISLLVMAAAQGDLSSAAELRFLGLMAAGAIAALAALTPRRPLAEWVAMGVISAAWCLVEGTLRGGFISVLLFAALGFAVRQSQGLDSLRTPNRTLLFTASAIVWQLLTRADLLLPPLLEARTVVSVAVLPLICGIALARLANFYGPRSAWVIGLAVAVVAPGFNVTVTMTLLAVAAGTFLSNHSTELRLDSSRRPESDAKMRAGASPAPTPDEEIADHQDLPESGGLKAALAPLGLAGLAALATWPLSLPVAVAALAPWLLISRRRLYLSVITLAIFATSFWALSPAAGGPPPWHGWESVAAVVALAVIVMPWGFLAAASRGPWVLGLTLCAAGAAVGGDPEALAPGLVLLASGLRDRGRDLQLQWSLAVTAIVGLGAGYPWLHGDPLLLIEKPLWWALAALGIAGAARITSSLSPTRSWGLKPFALTALGLSFFFVPSPPSAIVEHPRVLDGSNPEVIWEISATGVLSALVESNMVHGAHLEAGTEVASIELLDGAGRVVATAPILAGEHTADWAAGRPDITAQFGPTRPEPWSRRPSPDGTFFEQRYRATLRFPEPVDVAALRLRRHGDLPELTQLIVRRLELGP